PAFIVAAALACEPVALIDRRAPDHVLAGRTSQLTLPIRQVWIPVGVVLSVPGSGHNLRQGLDGNTLALKGPPHSPHTHTESLSNRRNACILFRVELNGPRYVHPVPPRRRRAALGVVVVSDLDPMRAHLADHRAPRAAKSLSYFVRREPLNLVHPRH